MGKCYRDWLAASLDPDYDMREGRTLATLEKQLAIDWMACELIECVPGKVSGRPVVRGTRIMPDAIANSFELGDSMEEIREGFPSLTLDEIRRLIEFAREHRMQTAS